MTEKKAKVSGDPKEPKVKASSKQEYFTTEMWKGVKPVLKCAKCGTFRDTRDAMIEHVLIHYPANEQEKHFESMMKE